MRRLGYALACLLAGGCSYKFEPASGQPGTLTLHPPGVVPTVVTAPAAGGTTPASTPPPGVEPVAPTVPAPPREGRYHGTARLVSNPSGRCDKTHRISNWTVSGDQVRFGGFRGTVRPDGSLLMRAGEKRIRGRFVDSRFVGQLFQMDPQCTYSLSLDLAE